MRRSYLNTRPPTPFVARADGPGGRRVNQLTSDGSTCQAAWIARHRDARCPDLTLVCCCQCREPGQQRAGTMEAVPRIRLRRRTVVTMAATVMVFAPTPQLTITIESAQRGAEVHLHAGGQGLWQARMIRSFGVEVTLCCALGGKTGRVLRA